MMTMYDCAMLEVKTKLEVLNNEFQIRSKRNPIKYIKMPHIKSQESIMEKLEKKGFDYTGINPRKT